MAIKKIGDIEEAKIHIKRLTILKLDKDIEYGIGEYLHYVLGSINMLEMSLVKENESNIITIPFIRLRDNTYFIKKEVYAETCNMKLNEDIIIKLIIEEKLVYGYNLDINMYKLRLSDRCDVEDKIYDINMNMIKVVDTYNYDIKNNGYELKFIYDIIAEVEAIALYEVKNGTEHLVVKYVENPEYQDEIYLLRNDIDVIFDKSFDMAIMTGILIKVSDDVRYNLDTLIL